MLLSGFLAWQARLSILLGAILVVSGPLPLLRHIRPIGSVNAILKWEGIVIDPIGAPLTVPVFEAMFSVGIASAPLYAIIAVLKTIKAGFGFGLLGAGLLALFLRKFWILIFYKTLYP